MHTSAQGLQFTAGQSGNQILAIGEGRQKFGDFFSFVVRFEFLSR